MSFLSLIRVHRVAKLELQIGVEIEPAAVGHEVAPLRATASQVGGGANPSIGTKVESFRFLG